VENWERYPRAGIMAVVRGKANLEETRASGLQVLKHPVFHYLMVGNWQEPGSE